MLEKKEYTEDKSYDCTKFEKHVTHVPVNACSMNNINI